MGAVVVLCALLNSSVFAAGEESKPADPCRLAHSILSKIKDTHGGQLPFLSRLSLQENLAMAKSWSGEWQSPDEDALWVARWQAVESPTVHRLLISFATGNGGALPPYKALSPVQHGFLRSSIPFPKNQTQWRDTLQKIGKLGEDQSPWLHTWYHAKNAEEIEGVVEEMRALGKPVYLLSLEEHERIREKVFSQDLLKNTTPWLSGANKEWLENWFALEPKSKHFDVARAVAAVSRAHGDTYPPADQLSAEETALLKRATLPQVKSMGNGRTTWLENLRLSWLSQETEKTLHALRARNKGEYPNLALLTPANRDNLQRQLSLAPGQWKKLSLPPEDLAWLENLYKPRSQATDLMEKWAAERGGTLPAVEDLSDKDRQLFRVALGYRAPGVLKYSAEQKAFIAQFRKYESGDLRIRQVLDGIKGTQEALPAIEELTPGQERQLVETFVNDRGLLDPALTAKTQPAEQAYLRAWVQVWREKARLSLYNRLRGTVGSDGYLIAVSAETARQLMRLCPSTYKDTESRWRWLARTYGQR